MKAACAALLLVCVVQSALAHRPAGLLTSLAAPDACQTCLVGVRIMDDFLCDPGAVEFLVAFAENRICPALGDSPRCHNLASGLLPVLVNWLRVGTTPAQLCSHAGVCGQALLGHPFYDKASSRAALRDDTECALCKLVVDRVKQGGSSVLEQMTQQALQVCSELPKDLQTPCADFVNQYEPLIAELINDLDSASLCTSLGVCQASLAALRAPPLTPPLALALGAWARFAAAHPAPLPPYTLASSSSASAAASAAAAAASAANDGCDYCKMAVAEVHVLISTPSVQQALVNYTKAICDSFPASAAECKAYVDQYAILVFTLAEQYLVPDTLCVQIGMCPAPPSPPAEATVAGQLRTFAGLLMSKLQAPSAALARAQQRLRRRVR